MLHENAFRHLEFKTVRIKTRFCKDRRNAVEKARGLELNRGDIDGNLINSQAAVTLCLPLPARFAQDPLADLYNEV